jgi:CBS domain-containing protein
MDSRPHATSERIEVAMHALTLRTVDRETLPVPGADPWFADPTDPALTVMTDFRERSSVTVADADPIDAALEHMKHAGVRSAFVVEADRRAVVGLITAYDIMGDKPMRYVQDHRTRRSEVRARDMMTPLASLRCVRMRDVERSTVGAVARAFEEAGLTHIPVVEDDERGATRLRGLLSAARVRRLLVR